jgi:hypothetical protein
MLTNLHGGENIPMQAATIVLRLIYSGPSCGSSESQLQKQQNAHLKRLNEALLIETQILEADRGNRISANYVVMNSRRQIYLSPLNILVGAFGAGQSTHQKEIRSCRLHRRAKRFGRRFSKPWEEYYKVPLANERIWK